MRLLLAVLIWLALGLSALASDIRIATTTSFHNSGLSDLLLPQIEDDLNLNVQLVVVGTGQALRLGRAGDVDAILVHSKLAEEKFVEEGYGTHRREIMYNDFALAGPGDDPASIKEAATITAALSAIKETRSIFVSRGDDSGTHRKEQALWKRAGLDITAFEPDWYRAAGAGMGATLNTASGMNAYVMSDRASWLKFANKGDLRLLFSGDPALFNQYAFLPVNPARHAHVKHALALELETWLTSEKGQRMIAEYEIDGEALFVPNAKPR